MTIIITKNNNSNNNKRVKRVYEEIDSQRENSSKDNLLVALLWAGPMTIVYYRRSSDKSCDYAAEDEAIRMHKTKPPRLMRIRR